MKENAIVSIIIPVYNVARFLPKLMSSVLSQTYPHFEVLLIDDGSTDGSNSLCEEYASKDRRVSVSHQEHQGVSVARNHGIELAQGKYLLFIDADDYVDKDILEKMLFAAENFDVDVVLCGIEFGLAPRISDIPANQVLKHDFIIDVLFPKWLMGNHCLTSVWAKLYKKEIFLDNNIYFELRKRGEDWLLNIRLFQCVRSIYYIPLPLYKYVRHEGSAMTSYLPEQFELWIENRNIWHRIIEKYKLQVDYKAFNTQWIIKVFYYLPFMIHSDSQYRKKLENILRSRELYSACSNSYIIKPYSFQLLKLLLKWHRWKEAVLILRIMSLWIYNRRNKI